jgi:hypothetical protein
VPATGPGGQKPGPQPQEAAKNHQTPTRHLAPLGHITRTCRATQEENKK